MKTDLGESPAVRFDAGWPAGRDTRAASGAGKMALVSDRAIWSFRDGSRAGW